MVEFSPTPAPGHAPDPGLNARVHALARALDADPPPGLRALVPGYVSLLVEFSPLDCDVEALARLLTERAARVETSGSLEGRRRTIPTVYGGAFGPDLDEVAQQLGLSPGELVERHTAAEQRVYMLGFSPGFPYLGDLPPELALPRRATPRERVPVGSVAIAERQTGIYSREMPGGWHLLGRTPVPLFDHSREPPAYLTPGDQVRFVAIDASEWDRYTQCPDDW